jgi:hypothetical protein
MLSLFKYDRYARRWISHSPKIISPASRFIF